jgi:hypothetical protein
MQQANQQSPVKLQTQAQVWDPGVHPAMAAAMDIMHSKVFRPDCM